MLALTLVLLFAAEPDPDPMPRFEAKLNGATSLKARLVKGVQVWELTGAGISGSAEVRLTGGDRPGKIVLRMKGVRNLEFFTVSDDAVTLNGALRSSPKALPGKADKPGDGLAVAETKDGIEVTMAFTRPGKQWKFRWVQVYRKKK